MKRKLTALLCFTFISAVISFGFSDDDKTIRKNNTRDHYLYIFANNIKMWLSNNGDGSHDPATDGNGLYWPAGLPEKSAVFADGLVYGAKVGNEIRVNGNTHRKGLQAGKIINGLPDNPDLTKYRVFKIVKDPDSLPPTERDARKRDYMEWPIEDGAPYIDVNNDGLPTPGVDLPKLIGDETLWYVANDMDSVRSTFTYGMPPMGVEFQTTIYAYNRFNTLGDVVFKKYKMINKGSNILKDMYVSFWSDPDLGDANDDFVGCDTLLDLGFCFNGDNMDGNGQGNTYGENPPAVGYTLLQGPAIPSLLTDSAKYNDRWKKGFRNLEMTSFMFYIGTATFPYRDAQQGVPAGSVEFYNNMQGLIWDGSPIIDPHTNQPTRYAVPGDPVNQTGWHEGRPTGWPGGPGPADRRMLVSSGPFNLAPGDTQEIVYAIHLARGSSHLNSVALLKDQSRILKSLYNSDFNIIPSPEKPVVHSSPQMNAVTLWWESNSENYEVFDPVLPDTLKLILNGSNYVIPVSDKTYSFEGYRIWQFKDKSGRDPQLISVVDLSNDVNKIYPYPYGFIELNGQNPPAAPLILSSDEGIRRFIRITKDSYTNEPLLNGSTYYFGITAYGYSRFSDPPVYESGADIIEVIPGRAPINFESAYNEMGRINFLHSSGRGDGFVYATIFDPSLITGHKYEVSILDSNRYSLVNVTRGDTLIKRRSYLGADSLSENIYDGFTLVVKDIGLEALGRFTVSKIRDVIEVTATGENNVFSTDTSIHLNSTGEWTIRSVNENSQELTNKLQDLAYNNLRYDDYEIRFTPEGSEYYSSGYGLIGPILKNDPKGKGRVPFEIWRIPSDTAQQSQRLVIKIFDKNRDTLWNTNGDLFESIYSFIPAVPYPDTLPNMSGSISHSSYYRIGNLAIKGELPAPGTIIKVRTWKPLTSQDIFTIEFTAPKLNSQLGKQNINNISAFPNPYYGANSVNMNYPPYVRFTDLPENVTIRIYSLAGVYITKLQNFSEGEYLDWNLRNNNGEFVGSGIYLAYIELPDIGTRVMKIAVVQ
jgi:hypothetical protein